MIAPRAVDIRVTTILAGVFAFSLCACASSSYLANQATKYNLALEQANNEQLLRNIIRASKDRPVYFSAFTKFSGTGISTGGSAAIGIGANEAYTLTPTFTVNPAFDISPLDSQEFMRGYLRAIEMSMIEYYWRMGWQKDLLLTIFIRKIQTEHGTYASLPENQKIYSEFTEFLGKRGHGQSLDLRKIHVRTNMGAPLKVQNATEFESLVKLTQHSPFSFEFPNNGSEAQLYKTEDKYLFCAKNDGQPVQTICEEDPDLVADNITLRSPEGIIYFLGQVVRAELGKEEKDAPAIYVKCDEDGQLIKTPLFFVRVATPEDTDPHVSVTYDGKRYVIPRLKGDEACGVQESMEVLSLVQQIIEMNKSIKELPVTETVRLQ